MEDNKLLKLVYTFFLGLLIAVFVGVGINTFYEGPQPPEYPTQSTAYDEKGPTPEQTKQQQEFDAQYNQYNEDMKPYNRNISILTLASAVVLLVISLVSERKVKILADGVMLGGLFTLLYSIGRSFGSEDSKYVFVAVTVGLVVVLYLGYHRFVRVHSLPSKAKK